MAERSNAAVLKTVDGQLSGGSNPSLSAKRYPTEPVKRFGWGFICSAKPRIRAHLAPFLHDAGSVTYVLYAPSPLHSKEHNLQPFCSVWYDIVDRDSMADNKRERFVCGDTDGKRRGGSAYSTARCAVERSAPPKARISLRQAESCLSSRFRYFPIKGVCGLIFNTIKYFPKFYDKY